MRHLHKFLPKPLKRVVRKFCPQLLSAKKFFSQKFFFQEYFLQEDHCFSIIFKHPRFVCKSLDFIAFDKNKALEWVEELRLLLNNKENGRGGGKKEENLNKNNFNENWWLLKNFKNADLDKNGKIGFNELWKLLKRLNLQLSELYVKALFKVCLEFILRFFWLKIKLGICQGSENVGSSFLKIFLLLDFGL